ncbi:TldD/PmbA family protein [bacterium]|nr:TldD/PmbA family protein [bacterium]
MKEFTDVALNAAKAAGAVFADMRIVDERQNRVYVERKSLKLIDETESFGYCVRVLVDGAWGFASNTKLTTDEVAKTAARAVAIARASRKAPKNPPAIMTPETGHIDTKIGPCIEDPFAVPNKDKAELLLNCTNTMLEQPNIVMAWGFLQFIKMHRIIANTDGSYLDLTNNFANPMLSCHAVDAGESQSRGYQGGAKQAGFEFIRKVDLESNSKKWAEEALLKCHADDTPKGIMDLVLDPMHLSLTMHESVGHPTELDRILGWEANMAGRSFVNPKMVGDYKYGSDIVNFTANNTLEGGLGSWFYDDDGVELYSFPMVKDGVLANLGCTRETAPLIGWNKSNGCCRSDGFDHPPINRIPNLYMEPGTDDNLSPDDLIAGIDRGVYIEGMGSFSIDQMRNNFQFGGDMFWMIENGRKTKPLKKVTYQAQTTQFWNSCDAIAGKKWWNTHGVMNCGKGEPMQVMRMTHGASFTRFRNIAVGGAQL